MRFAVGLHLLLYHRLTGPCQPVSSRGVVLPRTFADTDLLGGTADDQDGGVETLGQVKDQQVGPVSLVPPSAYLALWGQSSQLAYRV